MAVQIQLRGGVAADWTADNPILADRELGIETDTLKIKIGDGVTAWAALAYFGGTGVEHWRGDYDLSSNAYPIAGGSGGGAPVDGDEYYVTDAGTPAGELIPAGSILKKVSTGWRVI